MTRIINTGHGVKTSLLASKRKQIMDHNKKLALVAAMTGTILTNFAIADSAVRKDKEEMDACLMSSLNTSSGETTVSEIRAKCEEKLAFLREEDDVSATPSAVRRRIMTEREEAFDPYVIVPHKMNYILPASYTNNLNKERYSSSGGWSDGLKDVEAKFQISIKVPLVTDIFNEGDQIAFGFTLQSWWQLYATDISSPFRETNYQPEFFYFTPLNWHPFRGHTGLMVGIEHQSNGRSNLLSRSWNRAYMNLFFAKDNFIASFRPWYRIPEDKPASTPEVPGDDNPDITDYMGHFELALAYKWEKYELVYTGRRNFQEGNAGGELGFTFPLTGRLKGYL